MCLKYYFVRVGNIFKYKYVVVNVNVNFMNLVSSNLQSKKNVFVSTQTFENWASCRKQCFKN